MFEQEVIDIQKVVDKYWKEFLRFSPIGWGIGYRFSGGKIVSGTVPVGLTFYVQHKLTFPQLTRMKNILPIPTLFRGIRTDVIEVPQGFWARDDIRYRPIMGGDAAIHYAVQGTGTHGLATDTPENDDRYAESHTNTHVGANSDLVGLLGFSCVTSPFSARLCSPSSALLI